MAELVRSDSLALQKLVEERLAARSVVVGEDGQVAFDEASLTRTIDQRMGALAQVVEERMDSLERTMAEQVLALSNATTATMDRNLERMSAAAGAGGRARRDGRRGPAGVRGADARPHRRADGADRAARPFRQPGAGRQGRGASGSAATRRPRRWTRSCSARCCARSRSCRPGWPPTCWGRIDVRFQQVADQLHREGQGQAEAMLKVAEVLGAEDRPAVGPRRRGRRQRPADRGGSDVRRDPRDVGRSPRHRITPTAIPQ